MGVLFQHPSPGIYSIYWTEGCMLMAFPKQERNAGEAWQLFMDALMRYPASKVWLEYRRPEEVLAELEGGLT